MPRSIQVGVPSGWFSVTKLIARSSASGFRAPGPLNPGRPVVDRTTWTMPGVSHPSPTTVEDVRRVLEADRWPQSFVLDRAKIRHRDRLTGRLSLDRKSVVEGKGAA